MEFENRNLIIFLWLPSKIHKYKMTPVKMHVISCGQLEPLDLLAAERKRAPLFPFIGHRIDYQVSTSSIPNI